MHKERESQDISSGKAVGIMEHIIKAVVAGILTAVLALLSKDGEEE